MAGYWSRWLNKETVFIHIGCYGLEILGLEMLAHGMS